MICLDPFQLSYDLLAILEYKLIFNKIIHLFDDR